MLPQAMERMAYLFITTKELLSHSQHFVPAFLFVFIPYEREFIRNTFPFQQLKEHQSILKSQNRG